MTAKMATEVALRAEVGDDAGGRATVREKHEKAKRMRKLRMKEGT